MQDDSRLLPKPSDPHPGNQLVERYIAGECTLSERAAVERWIVAHPESGRALRAMRDDGAAAAMDDGNRDGDDAIDLVAAEQRILGRLSHPDVSGRRVDPRFPQHIGRRTLPTLRAGTWARRARLGISTLLSGIIVVAGVHLLHRDGSSTPTQRYDTAPGERATIHLPHGATMMLAPATSVRLHEHEITVQGEAYFDVTAHPTRPWTIHTRNAVVQVLGTRFAVRQYPGDSTSRVVVVDGRVALHATQVDAATRTMLTRTLSARTMALVTDSGITITPNIVTRDYTSWTEGRLVFDHTPLRDVVIELSRLYRTEIRVADSTLARKSVIAEIDITQRSLTHVLDALAVVLNAHYTRDSRAVVFAPGRIESQGPREVTPRTPVLPLSQQEHQYGR